MEESVTTFHQQCAYRNTFSLFVDITLGFSCLLEPLPKPLVLLLTVAPIKGRPPGLLQWKPGDTVMSPRGQAWGPQLAGAGEVRGRRFEQ